MRKSLKRALGVGVLGGVAYAAWRAWNARAPERARSGVEWSTAPFPFPPEPRPTHATRPTVTPEPATPEPATPEPATPEPATPKPATPKPATPKLAAHKAKRARTASWVEPNADGGCPPTHPIKAKLASGIYHAPGGANYARTKPDRCYVDEAAAAADGLRPSKI